MINQNEKVDRFAEEINKTALTQCKKIEKQTEKFRKSELEKLEADAKAQLEARLSYEAQSVKTNLNREISALAASGKSDIIMCRNKIMDEVFMAVREKLVAFTATDEYKKLLEESIVSLLNAIDGNVFIFVRQQDIEEAKRICSSLERVSAVKLSESIEIGLAVASNESETVFADDTLEKRLELQREEFMAYSGLTV